MPLLRLIFWFYVGWLLGTVIFTTWGVWQHWRKHRPRWCLQRPGDPPTQTGTIWRSLGHGFVVRLKWRGPVPPADETVEAAVVDAAWDDIKPDRTIH